jgi:hypothetical protein
MRLGGAQADSKVVVVKGRSSAVDPSVALSRSRLRALPIHGSGRIIRAQGEGRDAAEIIAGVLFADPPTGGDAPGREGDFDPKMVSAIKMASGHR